MPRAAKTFRMHAANPRDARPSSAERGYRKRDWGRLRDAHIATQPLCAHCLRRGITKAAREVDHIVPFDGLSDPLRLDPANLQSLCRACHARKTHGS